MDTTLKQFTALVLMVGLLVTSPLRAEGDKTASAADFAESVGHLFDKLPEKFRMLVEKPDDATNWYVILGPLAGLVLGKAWSYHGARQIERRRLQVSPPSEVFASQYGSPGMSESEICEIAIARIGFPAWREGVMWTTGLIAAAGTAYSAKQTLSTTGKLPWQIANERAQEKANAHIAGIANKKIEEVAPKLVEKAVDEQARPFIEKEAPKIVEEQFKKDAPRIVVETFNDQGREIISKSLKKAEEDRTPIALKALRSPEKYPSEYATLKQIASDSIAIVESTVSRTLLTRQIRRNATGFAKFDQDVEMQSELKSRLPKIFTGPPEVLEKQILQTMETYASHYDLLKPNRELMNKVYRDLFSSLFAEAKINGQPDKAFFDYLVENFFQRREKQ